MRKYLYICLLIRIFAKNITTLNCMNIRIIMVSGLLAAAIGIRSQEQQQFEPRWSIKNNLLYDATLTPNLGLEVVTGRHFSTQLFYGLHPWTFTDNKKLRHWSLMPEWRWWLQKKGPMSGWFWGIHGVAGEYNVGGIELPFGLFRPLRQNRYEGWFAGGGLTMGHAWPLSDHWRLEAAVGVGYVHTRYHQYEYQVCGDDLGSGSYSHVGLTKLALNVAYVFGKKSEPEAPVPEPAPATANVFYKPDYKLAYVTPQAEQEKTRQLSGRAFIDFVVNKTDIRPDYRDNAAELAKVLRTIDAVRLDTFATITHINIHGYASPESPYKHNTWLAEHRAQALADYVQSLMALPKDIFTIEATPEDWQGLRNALRTKFNVQSSKFNVQSILAVIDDPATDADQKEQLLKRKMPREWRLMLDSIFPALRHSDYEVTYTIRPFTVEEATRVIREKPQHLSLNEMFLVANTYKPGSQDYNDVFETAVRMYPDDKTANLNAAVIALEKNDLAAAKRYLQKAGNSPEAQNARAIVAIRENRLDDAEQLLRQCTIPQARHNLRELEQYRQSIK